MPAELTKVERLLLLKFVCAFAWADLEVKDAERHFVRRLVRRLKLDEQEQDLVSGWLAVPPRPEEVDPNQVPASHREMFLRAARDMISADGEISPEERETLELFERLLREPAAPPPADQSGFHGT